MRRVRFTETCVKTLGMDWFEGDVKRLPLAYANEIIRAGWAVDADTGEGAPRVPGASGAIVPDPVIVDLTVPG